MLAVEIKQVSYQAILKCTLGDVLQEAYSRCIKICFYMPEN